MTNKKTKGYTKSKIDPMKVLLEMQSKTAKVVEVPKSYTENKTIEYVLQYGIWPLPNIKE